MSLVICPVCTGTTPDAPDGVYPPHLLREGGEKCPRSGATITWLDRRSSAMLANDEKYPFRPVIPVPAPPAGHAAALRAAREAQIIAVLLDQDPGVILSTRRVGQLARVTSAHVRGPLADREAGDPGQACYRILLKMHAEGLVDRHRATSGDMRVFWAATDTLRAHQTPVAALPPLDTIRKGL